MLHLRLVPLTPPRRPATGHAYVQCGYGLHLDSGFAVEEDDPLLASFGITTPAMDVDNAEEALRTDAFAPGRAVSLLPSVDGDPDEVTLWSCDGVRLGGTIGDSDGWQLGAALEAGLPLQAYVLNEMRDHETGSRELITLLVAPREMVRISIELGEVLLPVRKQRRRLVLIADGRADLDLWDPAGDRGPAGITDLGLSPRLRRRLEQLRGAMAALRDDDSESGTLDAAFAGWAEEAIAEDIQTVWRRLRAELGSRCEVGLLGPDMSHPAWDPDQVTDDDHACDDIPF